MLRLLLVHVHIGIGNHLFTLTFRDAVCYFHMRDKGIRIALQKQIVIISCSIRSSKIWLFLASTGNDQQNGYDKQ